MSRTVSLLAVATLALAAFGVLGHASPAGAAEDAPKKHKPAASRAGGYSYSAADSINTYGDARGRYGSANSLRDPSLDRQTNAGPFDHGFFYDSGVGPGQHGNDAPFLH